MSLYRSAWIAVLLTVAIAGAALARWPMGGKSVPVSVPTGPVAEWVLDSGSITGSTVADASGNGNSATVVNGPLTFGAMGATFNGTTQSATNSSINVNGWTAISVCAWHSPSSASGSYLSLLNNSKTLSDNKGFDLAYSTSQKWFVVGNGSSYAQAAASGTFSVGSWYFVCGTYDGNTVRFYVNATQVASAPISGTLVTGT